MRLSRCLNHWHVNYLLSLDPGLHNRRDWHSIVYVINYIYIETNRRRYKVCRQVALPYTVNIVKQFTVLVQSLYYHTLQSKDTNITANQPQWEQTQWAIAASSSKLITNKPPAVTLGWNPSPAFEVLINYWGCSDINGYNLSLTLQRLTSATLYMIPELKTVLVYSQYA